MKGKFFFKALVILALTNGTATISNAQEYKNTPVTISKDKVRHNGELCYSHIVKERQTLYSISKAYNVSIEDIYRCNPTVKETGIKKNSILIIPILEERPSEIPETEKKKEMQPETTSEPKAIPEPETSPEPQTVTEQEIIPEPETVIEQKADNEDTETEEEIIIKSRIHTVKWFEDLDTIAEKYGVSVEAIMKANGLTGRKLTRRQKLIIPSPGEFPSEAPLTPSDTLRTEEILPEEPVETPDSTKIDENSLFPGMFIPKKDVAASLMLPLNASSGKGGSQGNMDFYSGVLLAIYEMSEDGISTDLDVYDIADGNIRMDADSLEKEDVVIGPVSAGDLSRLFEKAPENRLIVSPLDQRAEKLVYDHKNMIQAPTPYSVIYKDLLGWMKDDMKENDRAIVVSEKGTKPSDAVAAMMAAVDSSGIDYSNLTYSILEGRNVSESLAWLMTEDETAVNRVFIASESEAFVNDVVRNLNLMIHKKYKVTLYAPGRIRSFETIEVDNLHNTNLHVSLGYYIDYDDARVKDFLLKYRALYNTEPTQFAFQGYDLAKYFIEMCSTYGRRWESRIEESDKDMLQSKFRFRKTESGGYINTGVHRIVYTDGYQVVKAAAGK